MFHRFTNLNNNYSNFSTAVSEWNYVYIIQGVLNPAALFSIRKNNLCLSQEIRTLLVNIVCQNKYIHMYYVFNDFPAHGLHSLRLLFSNLFSSLP